MIQYFLLLLLTLTVAACGSGRATVPPGNAQPDRFLFERGTEELNQKGGIELPGTTLNESLSRALGPVLGASNPTTNFQFWYNHTISGS